MPGAGAPCRKAWRQALVCNLRYANGKLVASLRILKRARRAIGALLLLCVAMITAAPLAAVAVGDECEKKCCQRTGAAHACCKRKAGAAMAFTAVGERCRAGNANVGLARFDAGGVIALVALARVPMTEFGAALATPPARVEAQLPEYALFERPPPVQ